MVRERYKGGQKYVAIQMKVTEQYFLINNTVD